MKAYQIKATYLTGRHAGYSFVLARGGYVASDSKQHIDLCYPTERAAKMVCTKYTKQNARNHELELIDREYSAKKGRTVNEWMIYELEKYEVVEVEACGSI